jgi:hypothetical protein
MIEDWEDYVPPVFHRHAGIDWPDECPICSRDDRIAELEDALKRVLLEFVESGGERAKITRAISKAMEVLGDE